MPSTNELDLVAHLKTEAPLYRTMCVPGAVDALCSDSALSAVSGVSALHSFGDLRKLTEPFVLDGTSTTFEGMNTPNRTDTRKEASITRNKQHGLQPEGIKGRSVCRMQSHPRRFILPKLQRTTAIFPRRLASQRVTD